MFFATTLIAALAAATSVAAVGPIIPPSNPPSNGDEKWCSDRPTCLLYINDVRAKQEGLAPIVLPTNWDSLNWEQRLFTFFNLERTSRGIAPITTQINTYNSQVATAVKNDADPEAPAGTYGGWGSIWAGGQKMIPLAAIYGWMYYDGPGGFNLDCTATKTSGCWGHRDIILGAGYTQVNVLTGPDADGTEGMAALFLNSKTAPAAANTVLTWDAQKAHLA